MSTSSRITSKTTESGHCDHGGRGVEKGTRVRLRREDRRKGEGGREGRGREKKEGNEGGRK